MTAFRQRLRLYAQLIRLHRPIGTLLLLWPTLWALWLAADGLPSWHLLLVFSLGVFLMRSAGCAINDYADRDFDGHVSRTHDRPLASGLLKPREALWVAGTLAFLAFLLVLSTNALTVGFSIGAVLLAASYPFMKRHTALPQVVLGAAFAWGIPMAFTAQTGEWPPQAAWLLYTAVVLWTVVYDTFYAMVDRDDDLKIGVRSTAILFGEQDRAIIALLQGLTLTALVLSGLRFELGLCWYLGIAAGAGLFAWQQWLIRERQPAACFRAFLNNHWFGLVVFIGLALDKAL